MPDLSQNAECRVSVPPRVEIFVEQRGNQHKDKGIPKSSNHGGLNPTK
jgi:hypothetical protein